MSFRLSKALNAAARSAAHSVLSIGIAGTVVLAPLPALAGAPAEEAKAEEPAAEPAGEVGGTVALLRFGGADTDAGNELRLQVTEQLTALGYEVKGVARTVEDAAKKVKCKGELDSACLDKVGKYLNKNAKAEFDFFVYGAMEAPDTGASSVMIYDVAKQANAVEMKFARLGEDYILPLALPKAVGRAIADYQKPQGPLSEEDAAVIAALDEPEKTPEEVAAEEKKLEDAEKQRLAAYDQAQTAKRKNIDLKAEFEKYCRKGPREDQEVENEDGTITKTRDLRAACKRGPFWGYWQPRAYVALVLTGGLAVTTGLFYGLALGAHTDWKKASDDLQAAKDAGTANANDPNQVGDYANLAGKVSEAGANVRKNAILGDVFLGSTILLAGVLGIMIGQDRAAAKGYIEQQVDLADLRVGPMLGNGTYGASAGFRF